MLLYAFILGCFGFAMNLGVLFLHVYEYIVLDISFWNIVFSSIFVLLNYVLIRSLMKTYFLEKAMEPCNVQLDLGEVDKQPEEIDIKRNKLENGEEKKFKGRPRKEELPSFLMNEDDRRKARKRFTARVRYANASIEKRKQLSKHRFKK